MAQVTPENMQEVLKRAYGARTAPLADPSSAPNSAEDLASTASVLLSMQEQEDAPLNVDSGESLEALKRLAEAAEGDQADAIGQLVNALEAFDRTVET